MYDDFRLERIQKGQVVFFNVRRSENTTVSWFSRVRGHSFFGIVIPDSTPVLLNGDSYVFFSRPFEGAPENALFLDELTDGDELECL